MEPIEDIARLEAKLRAREGKPGFAANIQAIREELGRLEGLTYTYRDTVTKRFVTAEYAVAHPGTTERVEF